MILISHDRHLIETTADRLWLVAGGTVSPFDGDMEDYRRLVLAGDLESAVIQPPAHVEPVSTNKGEQRRSAAQKRAELAPLRDRQKEAEKRMAKLQSLIAELDDTLANPDLFSKDPAMGAELSRDRARAVEALARAEEEWLEAGEALEAATV